MWTATMHRLAMKVLSAEGGIYAIKDDHEREAADAMVAIGALFLDAGSSDQEMVVRRGTITNDETLQTDIDSAIVIRSSLSQTRKEVETAMRQKNKPTKEGRTRKSGRGKRTQEPKLKAEAKPKEEPKPKAKRDRGPNTHGGRTKAGNGICLCGCGKSAARLFLQGHDARLKGYLIRVAAGVAPAEEITAARSAAKVPDLRSSPHFSRLLTAAGL